MNAERRSQTIEILHTARPRSLVLEIQDDEGVRHVPLGDAPLVVGSGRAADIVLRDRTVSQRHCTIALAGAGIAVADLASRNGTYLGGARVREGWGGEGAAIIVGRTSIVCVGASDDDDDVLGAPLPEIAGASAAIRKVATQVRRLARLSAPVLVSGETGVGKELVARALHREGHRRNGPFVALNVAALPRELVESELFGHERGAFTGAVAKREGAFAEAEGGTLFLDEIGELPREAQPKLLRALDGYGIRRIGGAGSGDRIEVRVVAATHVPLLEHVNDGGFRRDLYHRLEVFVVEVPPLRARRGDIFAVARSLLLRMAPEIGERELTPGAVAHLTAYEWPGNVRELRNVLLRSAAHAPSDRWIDVAAVQRALRRSLPPPSLNLSAASVGDWLTQHKGNVSAAARAARMPRTSFRKMLARATAEPPLQVAERTTVKKHWK